MAKLLTAAAAVALPLPAAPAAHAAPADCLQVLAEAGYRGAEYESACAVTAENVAQGAVQLISLGRRAVRGGRGGCGCVTACSGWVVRTAHPARTRAVHERLRITHR